MQTNSNSVVHSARREALRRPEARGHAHYSTQAALSPGELLDDQGDRRGALAAYEAAPKYDHPNLSASAQAQVDRLRGQGVGA